ncbi:DUF551 domain-containing protein [Stenotrophomonas sp. 278]|uniref:DUF551 domain-containing protein n=1 Tax=Stenotrophomonas sp. 278 TaxID=2479851 RepID=UPI000F6858DF|nr:DUF551 domain-containing protein [Stenotrophomonas sp. 278]RRU17861.1 DUF551 domain-containing protein [Stenotrophomonas sp. 278]
MSCPHGNPEEACDECAALEAKWDAGFAAGRKQAEADFAARQPVGEVVAWGVRIGDSDTWGYVEVESDADFIGKQSGLPYEKKPLYAAPPRQTSQAHLEGLDRLLGETIDQRDRYHEAADELAESIERITGVEIGEHSSANFPWQNAIEAAEEYQPAQVEWQPIETAPKAKHPMIVVIAVWDSYVSDVYGVFWDGKQWARWPHKAQPTHWMPLPAAPAIDSQGNGNG